jgi:hypothetical protein
MNQSELIALINALNETQYEHTDLMGVAIEFYEEHTKDKENIVFANAWNQPAFLQQTVACVREALVLSSIGLKLQEGVPFNELITGCTNSDLQNFHVEQLNLNPVHRKIIIDFWNALSCAVFKNVFEDNSDLIELTGLTEEILQSRLNLFLERFA